MSIEKLWGIAARPWYHPQKPDRDAAYLRFIRTWPCIGCGKRRWIQACHTGPHATSQKSSDYTAVPCCGDCHRELDANPFKFQERRGISIPDLITMFRFAWQRRQERKAA